MPCDYSKYPKNWKNIREKVLRQAENRCQFCRVPNHRRGLRVNAVALRYLEPGFSFTLYRSPHQGLSFLTFDDDHVKNWFLSLAQEKKECIVRETRIVLTIAHTSANGANPDDLHDLRELMALCQACHLHYDHDRNMRKAEETRRRKWAERNAKVGQTALLIEE